MIDACYLGDVRDGLRAFAAAGIKARTCVTSPPYWGLRDYGVDGQMGLEPTPAEFVERMVEVFRLVRDVLTDDGTLWMNLGDSYNARPEQATNVGSNTTPSRYVGNLKPKDLVGIPWRIAFALQADGWFLRQDIIWSKPNPMPESVRDRCTKAHEYLFLLSKRERYYYDAGAIARPITGSSQRRLAQPNRPNQPGSDRVPNKTNGNMKAVGPRFSGNKYGDDDREECRTKSGNEYTGGDGLANRRSVWTIPTESFRDSHFAVMPTALVEPCILAGSEPGDIVLDPFMGSGTVAQVAQNLGRRWIGCELNPAYHAMIARRSAQAGLVLA